MKAFKGIFTALAIIAVVALVFLGLVYGGILGISAATSIFGTTHIVAKVVGFLGGWWLSWLALWVVISALGIGALVASD